MAIVKMNSFSLFTFDGDRDKLLHELQKFGDVHFTNLNEDKTYEEEGLKPLEVPYELSMVDEEIQKVNFALNLLKNYDDRETGIKGMIKGKNTYTFTQLEEKVATYDYDPVIQKLRELTEKQDQVSQDELSKKALLEELRPWKKLDYAISALRNYTFSQVYTGLVPKKLIEGLKESMAELTMTHMETLYESKDDVYVLAMTGGEEKDTFYELLRNHGFNSMVIPGEDTPEEEIKLIKTSLEELKSERSKLKEEIKSMKSHLGPMEEVYEYLLNKKLRFVAQTNFMKTDNVSVLQGYVPVDETDNFKKAVETSQSDAFYLSLEEASEEENVPILLKNGKFTRTFEALTTMYSMPSYGGIDPTPYFAPFYFAFFGMMVADLAYGILLFLAMGAALKFFNLDKGTKLFVQFLFYLSFSVMAWGLIYGSFFGDLIQLPALIRPMEQFQDLLIVSIIFGGIHLFYALGIKAALLIRDGKPLEAIYDVGFWYMSLMGGIGFLLSMVIDIPSIVATVALVVMVVGMVGIIATGGRESESIGGKLAGGVYSLYGISGYIGDFVSYSRLMALGLAGGFIAVAMNMIMSMLFDMGPLGIIPGIIIFIGGQLFNLFLSALSAYVHTARLTYVEFFSKFYEGGGKAFKTFRNKSKYINLD